MEMHPVQLKPNLDGGRAGGEGRVVRYRQNLENFRIFFRRPTTVARSYSFYHCAFLYEYGV